MKNDGYTDLIKLEHEIEKLTQLCNKLVQINKELRADLAHNVRKIQLVKVKLNEVLTKLHSMEQN